MTSAEKLLLFALEAARSDQIDALIALSLAKGVPLAEIVEEAVNRGLAKEFADDEEGLL